MKANAMLLVTLLFPWAVAKAQELRVVHYAASGCASITHPITKLPHGSYELQVDCDSIFLLNPSQWLAYTLEHARGLEFDKRDSLYVALTANYAQSLAEANEELRSLYSRYTILDSISTGISTVTQGQLRGIKASVTHVAQQQNTAIHELAQQESWMNSQKQKTQLAKVKSVTGGFIVGLLAALVILR